MIEILATVQSALGISKQIRELAEKASTAEFKLAIANLTEQLAEIKLQAVELSAENQRLKDEIRDLKAAPVLQFRENAYYHDDGTGPYCPGGVAQILESVRRSRKRLTGKTGLSP